MDYDRRKSTWQFDDGTLLLTLKLVWTHFPPNGKYGEERFQISTTVARGSYIPVGTVAIERVELEVFPPFALDKALVAIADPDADRPVITVQWAAQHEPHDDAGPCPPCRGPFVFYRAAKSDAAPE
ncbi:hypothetical protein AB0D37_06875 [Streptomyces sp. NPDC048384]|uniref:hypothetical protein n=1 Tax=Streptomyces sp. NPDC048384 TaxID=3155487 RepID=UPI003438D97D